MNYRFTDLVDVKNFSALLQAFYEATGILHGLVDPEGDLISSIGWQDACTKFHRVNAETCARCVESNNYLAEHVGTTAGYVGSACKNGLMDYATPIVVEGRQLATLYFGQVLLEVPDMAFFRKQAQAFGFDETAYLEAIGKVPVVSAERIDAIMAFYTQLAQMLAQEGLDGLRQRKAEQRLDKLNRELEQRVEVRTAELAARNASLSVEIDERRKAETELAQAHSQLIQSEKMAAIGQLAAGVAHEINNPVAFVLSNFGTLDSYVEKLLRVLAEYESLSSRLPEAERVAVSSLQEREDIAFLRDDVAVLLRESKDGLARVRRIIADLKDFSHTGTEEWELADIEAGIDATLNLVWAELKYKAQVIKEYGRPPSLLLQPAQINQVAMNLLVNAAQAIEGNGTITIRTGADKDHVWFEIADSGAGIEPDRLNRIFEPFYTTKPVGKGTGLGLSVSFGIVQKHRGRIDVQSKVGEGTTFRVWLPMAAGKQ